MDKLFEGKPPPIPQPKVLVPLVAAGLFLYDRIASRGVIGMVRLTKDEQGQYDSEFFMDANDQMYDGLFEHARIIKEDVQAREYVERRRYTSYPTDDPTKHPKGNGHTT